MTVSVQRFHVGPRLSEIAIHNGTVYLAGQIAEDKTQDITGQTSEVLGHIDRLLAEAGSDKSFILSATLFIREMSDFAKMNQVWDAWIPQGATPPRATVRAELANPDCLIEIQVIAAQKDR